VCGCEDTATSLEESVSCLRYDRVEETYVDHPVGNLAHAKTGCVTELLFFFLGRVGMVRVTM
jgi:hypothetical protein